MVVNNHGRMICRRKFRQRSSGEINAGVVNVVQGSVTGNQLWIQDPLAATNTESGDRFGWTPAVGSPFEDWGATDSAGVVHTLHGRREGLATFDNQIWHQNKSDARGSMQDLIEAGDRFGFTLVSGDFDNDGREDLAVGVPREDIGSVVDAGAIAAIYGWGGPMNLNTWNLTTEDNQFWHQNSGGFVIQPIKVRLLTCSVEKLCTHV